MCLVPDGPRAQENWQVIGSDTQIALIPDVAWETYHLVNKLSFVRRNEVFLIPICKTKRFKIVLL